jgi:CBS domain-containing protein
MLVREIMTVNPVCCAESTALDEVARHMLDHDCGSIPVVDRDDRPVGIVTDRDIVTRVVATGLSPVDHAARDCMSSPVVSVRPDDTVELCCQQMEQHQVRRVIVVNDRGACCGIVSQADVAREAPPNATGEVVKTISEPAAPAVAQ